MVTKRHRGRELSSVLYTHAVTNFFCDQGFRHPDCAIYVPFHGDFNTLSFKQREVLKAFHADPVGKENYYWYVDYDLIMDSSQVRAFADMYLTGDCDVVTGKAKHFKQCCDDLCNWNDWYFTGQMNAISPRALKLLVESGYLEDGAALRCWPKREELWTGYNLEKVNRTIAPLKYCTFDEFWHGPSGSLGSHKTWNHNDVQIDIHIRH
jgi:hypothetical protein